MLLWVGNQFSLTGNNSYLSLDRVEEPNFGLAFIKRQTLAFAGQL